jgi:hypothetical protein
LAAIRIVTLFQELQLLIHGSIVVHAGLARFHAAECWGKVNPAVLGALRLLRRVTLQGNMAFCSASTVREGYDLVISVIWQDEIPDLQNLPPLLKEIKVGRVDISVQRRV